MDTVTGCYRSYLQLCSRLAENTAQLRYQQPSQFRGTALRGQGAEAMNVEAGGIYSYQRALMVNSTDRSELVLLFVCWTGALSLCGQRYKQVLRIRGQ
jgi:hypothetical protein